MTSTLFEVFIIVLLNERKKGRKLNVSLQCYKTCGIEHFFCLCSKADDSEIKYCSG